MRATQDGEKVCYPIVLVKVNGIACRALLETGATVSNASAYLLQSWSMKPTHTLSIVEVVTKRAEIFNVRASDTKKKYATSLSVTRIDRAELLSFKNPNYSVMICKYPHLK